MERIVCLLIFFSLKCFALEEFIFWAELSSKNFVLFHQSQNISLAMTKSENRLSEYACEIPYTEKDLKTLPRNALGLIEAPKMAQLAFLNVHKEELSECFIGAKISVKDVVKADLLKAKSETYVKILPLRFSVDFSENGVIIYYLRKKD
ncbi:hypothetical protein [Campylobacter helveticus]|uniref:Flagellar-associated protein FlgQ n=1 Tax=Campylobacter helveticus TaxID=28898 RepID=A0AAX2UKV9_9BACT|nr:hypothetical protein [Campylobacter helveticus]MCR2053885.1 hypothetical protein [Campylobacter helveticus]TNB57814.1 hypothetical protein FDW42_03960 [Campylobacter helveticus]TNB59865.1 hypothetical protein FDW44_01495 [Campylobacter helveticus]TNH33560.1 hypothetical protein FDW48_04595 [Campylobacter helveticus]TXK56715.1 hypothetical protein A9726_02975 [Campylobacter helveticus]